jgi:hypothetical protein
LICCTFCTSGFFVAAAVFGFGVPIGAAEDDVMAAGVAEAFVEAATEADAAGVALADALGVALAAAVAVADGVAVAAAVGVAVGAAVADAVGVAVARGVIVGDAVALVAAAGEAEAEAVAAGVAVALDAAAGPFAFLFWSACSCARRAAPAAGSPFVVGAPEADGVAASDAFTAFGASAAVLPPRGSAVG